MAPPSIFSQRLLRKGPLVEDTYRLFSRWDFAQSAEKNMETGLHGGFRTMGWEREVKTTIGRRLRNFGFLKPLIVLAARGMPIADWRDCWRLWVGATEQPFGSFVQNWLYDEFQSGRYNVRSENARKVASAAWVDHDPAGKQLSDYGVLRAARDLLKTAVDLGLLSGRGPAKTFAAVVMADDVFLFHVHLIAEIEGSYAKVPSSLLWRLAMLAPDEVNRSLLRLHQYRKLDYQVAGSFVQLTLPQHTALRFAETINA